MRRVARGGHIVLKLDQIIVPITMRCGDPDGDKPKGETSEQEHEQQQHSQT